MLVDQISTLRGKAYDNVNSSEKKIQSSIDLQSSQPRPNYLKQGSSWFASWRQQQNSQESENEISEKKKNVDCYELEVEIIKIRRQVERIREVDTRKDEADVGAMILVSEIRDNVKKVTDECQCLMDETSALEKKKFELDLQIQKHIKEKTNNLAKIRKIDEEDRELKKDHLQKIAEMEQMEFFHKEMQVMLGQFLMNEMNLEMEFKKDKIKYLELEVENNERMIMMEEIERDIQALNKRVKISKNNRNAAMEKAQALSMINDELNQDLDALKSTDCDQKMKDGIQLRWVEYNVNEENNSTNGFHPFSLTDSSSEKQLKIIHDQTKDNDSIANQTA